MRRWTRGVLIVAILAALAGIEIASVYAAGGTSRRHAFWGRFSPGTWRVSRSELATFDPQGEVASSCITETRTTLAASDAAGVTLEVREVVEIAGKRLEADPRRVVEVSDDGEHLPAGSVELGTDVLTLDGQNHPCRIVRYEEVHDNRAVAVTSWYCRDAELTLLKRETEVREMETDAIVRRSTMRVVSLGRYKRVLNHWRRTYEVETVEVDARGTTRSRGWHAIDVPGGLIEQESEELDAQGRLVRRSRHELVEYQTH